MSETCFKTKFSCCSILVSLGLLVPISPPARADEQHVFHIRPEAKAATQNGRTTTHGVRLSAVSPGDLTSPIRTPNDGSWQFDGRSAIAYAVPGNTEGFSENFTWEGFFLSPAENTFLPETGIADRLLTQFAFDQGDWTRLAIGLVADDTGAPRLCLELEGFEGRSFGMGDRAVSADQWHHFALVHEGTAAAAAIRWYLDYRLTGELYLGGQSHQNTLRPPGPAPFTIGARLRKGNLVDRGFHGFIDEVRMVPRPLTIDEFLRAEQTVFSEAVDAVEAEQQQRELFWKSRHRWAREQTRQWSGGRSDAWSIDAFFDTPVRPIDDRAFLRRLSLAVRGRIPTLDEVISFTADDEPDKRVRMVDHLLESTEWGDGWVGYWQDVLAENPSVVFPTLNNSGAFRRWIYESFRDNKPFDRFATELILMENYSSSRSDDDGPAGFALATGNDVPMAMRSHVAMKAFAAVDLKCARCHDSPVDDFLQADLFRLAAYLNGGRLEVPETSVAAVGRASQHGVITTSLAAGEVIQPTGLSSHWLDEREEAISLKPIQPGPRAELAALITSPRKRRFSDVIVNRIWKRYFGTGLVEPVDQWNEHPAASQPELFRKLSAEFVQSGYSVKALARRILSSGIWQGQRQLQQRMSAEQLIDSLFVSVGKDFHAETPGGATDELGRKVVERPISIPDFHATIMAALGVNPATEQYDGDRPIPITDHGTAIGELFS